MHDIVVTNFSAAYIDAATELPSGGWIAVDGTRVSALGGSGDPRPPARRTMDAGGRVVTPGLINTHHHIYQNLTRSYRPAVNGSLFQWLTTLYPIWARLDEEAIYWSTWVGLAELLLGGCTTTSDHLYVHPRPRLIDAQVKAAADVGMRFYATRGSMSRSQKDGFLPPDSVVQDADQILADSERLIGAFHDPSPGALVRVALAPCSPFTVDEPLMAATAELAAKHDVRLHTHLAEDRDELAFTRQMYGRATVEHFEHVGWAHDRSWVAHFVFPTDDEAARLATAGVGVAHCPSSNMLICHGTADVMGLRSLGMAVGLGCDGSASTDHASLWMEARTALLLARYRGGPQAMGARDALDVATNGSARCLGWDDEIGQLRAGALADLVVWDMSPFALAGTGSDPIEALLRCGPARAWITMVGGRMLVEDGELRVPGAEAALSSHRAITRALQGLD
jgi:cytosine/adenosine deaminase-related metal-dependent hydrolase